MCLVARVLGLLVDLLEELGRGLFREAAEVPSFRCGVCGVAGFCGRGVFGVVVWRDGV